MGGEMSEFSAEDKLKPIQDMNDFLIRRIAELEVQLADAQTSVHALETDLHLSNSQIAEAQKKVDRYRDALSDIQEHTAGEGGDGYAMQEIADAAMESE